MPPPKEGVDLRDRIYLHYAKMSVCLDLIPGDVKGKFYREGLIITSTLATKKKTGMEPGRPRIYISYPSF